MVKYAIVGLAGALVAVLAVGVASPAAAEPLDPDPPAPARVEAPAAPERHPTWLRAVIEESLGLGGGAVWYWLTPDRQLADWDYPSLEQRLTLEAWRFDNNSFATNYLWHAFGGMGFHVFGRANDLGLAPSVGLGFATSFAWEYLLEFREKVSVNDVLYTTGSGVAIGEFAHWLGRYLDSSPRPNHPLRAAARWSLGLAHAAHGAMDGRSSYRAGAATDALGFSRDIWHQFALSYGVVLVDADGTRTARSDPPVAHQLRIDAELAALPGYLAPGRMRRTFADGNVTRLRSRITLDGTDVDTDVHADTILLGAHVQDLDAEGAGHAATVGVGVAFQYRRERLGSFSDRLGLLHLPALALDDHLLGRCYRLSVSLRLYADFAGVESAAYPLWKAAHPDAVEKTILRREGYYFGWGLSGRLAIELVLPRWAFGGAFFGGWYDSQEGLDRSQELVTNDVNATDRLDDFEAWIRAGPVFSVLALEARWSHQTRESGVGGYRARQSLDRYTLDLRAMF